MITLKNDAKLMGKLKKVGSSMGGVILEDTVIEEAAALYQDANRRAAKVMGKSGAYLSVGRVIRNSPFGVKVTISANEETSAIEIGNSDKPAQPFLRPAYESNKMKLIKIAASNMKQEIKRVAK